MLLDIEGLTGVEEKINNDYLEIKGEVRTINDRNICERRSCMKNNGKSPTFKFVSGEERETLVESSASLSGLAPPPPPPPPYATHSSADLTWIRKWLEIHAPELSELESVEPELGCCCSNLDKPVSDEICRTRKRQFEIPFRLVSLGRIMPPSDFVLDSPGRLSRNRRRTDRKDFYHVPQHHKILTHVRNIFSSEHPL